MERLTIKRDKKNAFQSMYYAECKEYENGCGIISCPFDCPCEIEEALFDRLGQIEDILGDDYDLERLRLLVESTKDIPTKQVLAISKIYKWGEMCKNESTELPASHRDPVGPEGDPGLSVKIVCLDESSDVTPEKWKWITNRFMGEK